MGTQYSTMKVLILTSAMLALAASDSCSDCTAVVSHIAGRLSTPESLAAQGEILVGELCPGAPDPEACVSGLPGLWNQIAALLWPGYWDPTAEWMCADICAAPEDTTMTCDECKMTVTHNPGQLLQVDTNGRKFKGFKIARVGSGNEREIVINGKKLGSGDYTLTDNSFSTKVTVADGNWIQPKITWEGKLPKTKSEAEAFFLKNSLNVEATGSKRSFNGALSWKMDKPDFDFTTPWNCKLNLTLQGEGPNWGTYHINRDMKAAVANKVIEFAVTGDADFTKGVFSKISPVKTEVDLKYVMDDRDLIGKFSKVMNGKEYSVDFPVGSGVLPKIIWGQ